MRSLPNARGGRKTAAQMPFFDTRVPVIYALPTSFEQWLPRFNRSAQVAMRYVSCIIHTFRTDDGTAKDGEIDDRR
jgi:hypothetical protein